ncbi:MAG TPA: ATP-grasp domain-containing protein [Bacillota bacterium]|nr:ATP-grasp domain-containing protein [Bacillota bacterium]
MKILVLGAGYSQLNAIRRLKQLGHLVVVSDYYENPPAKAVADFHEPVSTFDVAANIAVARKHGVDALMTLGTDQPVYTAARVAQELGLPSLLDVVTAKAVTNKRLMKYCFVENNLPTVNFRLVTENFRDEELAGLTFPLVVKPLDSQGQRGVYKLDSVAAIRQVIGEVLSYSREAEILVEEYYSSDEITVSGWVVDGRVYLISVVDRISQQNFPHIGICVRHRFPSQYQAEYLDQIQALSRKIARSFNISNGPIYFQMLIGDQGLKINEIACRLGGAYEDEYLLEATGIDILGMLLDTSQGRSVDEAALQRYDISQITKAISVELFFARPGQVGSLSDMDALKRLPGVIQANHHLEIGSMVRPAENATARAGFVIVAGQNEAELAINLERVYRELGIYDPAGNNMVMRF